MSAMSNLDLELREARLRVAQLTAENVKLTKRLAAEAFLRMQLEAKMQAKLPEISTL